MVDYSSVTAQKVKQSTSERKKATPSVRNGAPSIDLLEVGLDQYKHARNFAKRQASVKDSSIALPYSAGGELLDDAQDASIGSDDGDKRSAYKSVHSVLPAIPEKGDVS